METLQSKDLTSIRVPKGGDRVHKEECVYSFHTPVCMRRPCGAVVEPFRLHVTQMSPWEGRRGVIYVVTNSEH